MKKLIGQVFGVKSKAFELVLIFDSRVKRILPDYEPIASVLNNNHVQTLFAFEADPRSIRRKYR